MEEDWAEITDSALRKRIQNRLAQRKHRRKAQEQAASHGDTTQNTTSTTPTPNHPWNLARGGETYFSPLFDLPTEAGTSPKTRVDNNFDTATVEDPTGEHYMTGFARPQGNLGARNDCAGDTVTGRNPAGILNDAGDLGMRHGFRPDRWAAGSHQYTSHPGGAPMAAGGFGQQSARDMMPQQAENSQQPNHHQHHRNAPSFSDNSNLSARAVARHHSRRCSTPGTSVRADHLENCSECGAQNRQSHQRTPRSVGNTRIDPHPNSGQPSPASAAQVHDHMSHSSPPSTNSPSLDILQEHGIDISQIMSHIDSERRSSSSAASGPLVTTPPPYARSVEVPLFDHNHSSRSAHRPEQWDHPMNLGAAHDNHDLEYMERPVPRVTKVVVIYMDERARR